MPNVPSAVKAARQNKKRNERNRALRSTLRTFLKKAETQAAEGASQEQADTLKVAMSKLGKAGKKNLVHPKKASRLASRLQLRVNKLLAEKQG